MHVIALLKMMPIVGEGKHGAEDGNLQPSATISLRFNADKRDANVNQTVNSRSKA
jgi:hypothetical protein